MSRRHIDPGTVERIRADCRRRARKRLPDRLDRIARRVAFILLGFAVALLAAIAAIIILLIEAL